MQVLYANFLVPNIKSETRSQAAVRLFRPTRILTFKMRSHITEDQLNDRVSIIESICSTCGIILRCETICVLRKVEGNRHYVRVAENNKKRKGRNPSGLRKAGRYQKINAECAVILSFSMAPPKKGSKKKAKAQRPRTEARARAASPNAKECQRLQHLNRRNRPAVKEAITNRFLLTRYVQPKIKLKLIAPLLSFVSGLLVFSVCKTDLILMTKPGFRTGLKMVFYWYCNDCKDQRSDQYSNSSVVEFENHKIEEVNFRLSYAMR